MPRAWRPAAIAVLLVLLAASGGILLGSGQGHPGATSASDPGGHAASGATGRSSLDTAGPGYRAVSGRGPTAPSKEPVEARLEASGSGAGAAPATLFPPNPDRPLTAPGAASVTVPYASAPAPMGLSDLGVGANGTYEYGASSFEAGLTLQSLSAFAPTNNTNLADSAPDWILVQLDTVAVNVTVPPASSTVSNGTFWVQNGLHLNGSTAEFEDNIWNFSNKALVIPSSALHGVNGSVVPEGVYVGYGPNFSVAYPLTVDLYDNITTTDEHTVVSFAFWISDSFGTRHGTYDVVTFNGGSSASSPSQFLVNGASATPAGLLYDAELDLGGNGGGANTNILALNGSLTLEYAQGTSVYHAVPSAFDFGVDSSETSLGVAVEYTGTTVHLSAGPSFLNGLWNTNGTNATRIAPYAKPGWIQIRITVSPNYALAFATTDSSLAAAGSLTAADFEYAPTTAEGTLTTDLPETSPTTPYGFEAWADGYAPQLLNVSSNSTPYTLTLLPSPAIVDAPVYLLGTSQAMAFGTAHISGTGYAPTAKKLWLNASQDDLAPPFLRVNDLGYPTFPLLAALRVNLSIYVNGFVQAPESFNYTDEAGKTTELANYTQGYFFYYGDGRFTVENTTIEGNSTLASGPPRTFPPSTIAFYHTNGGTVRNLTVAYDAIGVEIDASTGVNVSNLSVEGGALGIRSQDASDVSVVRASASGHDPLLATPSTLVDLLGSSTVSLTNLSVAGNDGLPATGVVSQGGSGLTITQLTVTSGAQGFAVNDTDSGAVKDLTVGGGLAFAGSWSNSTPLSFDDLAVNGTGLYLSLDTSVSVDGGSAVGFDSAVVDAFLNSSGGTFRSIEAIGGADGVILLDSSTLNVSDIEATEGSVGAYLSDVSSASGTDFTSTASSVGLLLNETTGGTFSSFVTTNQSIGAFVANSTKVTLGGIEATNTSLAPFNYFTNASAVSLYPIAGVGLFNDSKVNVTHVSAFDYPYAVVSNDSTHVNVSLVTDLYGNESVMFNSTNDSRITEVFAFSDVLGASVQNCSGTTVATSTFELSAGVGLLVANVKGITVEDNNFIGNNGSSVDGKFSLSSLQAWANNTTGSPAFKDNYWADRSGSAAYIINSTGPNVSDASPLSAPYSTYLRFTESGLPTGTNWTVEVLGEPYTTNVSLLELPGWAIVGSSVPFSVNPAVAKLGNNSTHTYPPKPASGTLSWQGSSESQSISFGPSSSSGLSLPLSVLAEIGAGAAAAAVVIVLLLWRRGGRKAPPPRDPLAQDPLAELVGPREPSAPARNVSNPPRPARPGPRRRSNGPDDR